MPSSARKSSLGSRRAQQKAHVPYRGDNPGVGKKTGITIENVQRRSDGFEHFGDILSQADNRTPPNKRRRRRPEDVILDEDEEDDENGEMSMDVESPIQYVTSNRQRYSPVVSSRAGSSSRPVPRSSDADYDSVPGPRFANSSRKSTGRPSRLSKSFNAQDLEDEDDDDRPFNDTVQSFGNDDFDPPPPMADDGDDTNMSLMDMDREGEDEDDEAANAADELPQLTPKARPNGKAKQVEPDYEYEEVADALDPGPEDVEMDDQQGQDEDEDMEEEQEEPPRPSKKSKEKAKDSSVVRSKSGSKKENRPVPEGVRRSQRKPMAPLEWWRLERVVYGRPNHGKCLLPHVKEVIRIPKEEAQPLGKKRKRAGSKKKSTSEPPDSTVEGAYNPEEGWDNDTGQLYKVLNFPFKEEVERRICFPARFINPQEAANADWKFQKIFGDGDFIAAGQLVIPPHSRKPSKMTKDNTYIFYVIEGAVNLKVHETSMILCTGASFMVPRGNTYFIENIADRDAKLFFTQARKTYEEEELLAEAAKQRERDERGGSSRTPQPRSSSAGMPSSGKGDPFAKRAQSSRI